MCLAMPGRVLSMDQAGSTGRVEVLGAVRTVNLSLLDDVAPGDWVLVQLGFAVRRMSGAEAAETVALLEELETALQDVAALAPGEAEP